MRAAGLLLSSFLGIFTASYLRAQPPSIPALLNNGSYLGFQRMESLSPDDPSTKWYHENTLFIRNDEFILDQAPVTIRKGRKTYSASDGGFLVYRGRILSINNGTYAVMRLFSSDYVIFRSGPKECEPYSKITVSPVHVRNGTLEVAGVLYRPKTISEEMRQFWTKSLSEQTVEYNGKLHYRDPNAQPCPVPPEFKSR